MGDDAEVADALLVHLAPRVAYGDCEPVILHQVESSEEFETDR
jgi:hypothetical protein